MIDIKLDSLCKMILLAYTKKKKIPRNAYINKALVFYNDLNKRENLKEQLQYESKMVKSTSLDILDEFEKLEYEIIE